MQNTQGQPGAVLQDAGSAIWAKGAFFQLGWLGAKDASVPVAAKSALPTLYEMPLGVGRGDLVCCYRAASFSPRDIMILVLVP